MLTQEILKANLVYEPDTGHFRWLAKSGSPIKEGTIAGSIKDGYIRIKIQGKNYYAQRLVWLYMYNENPVMDIDHINGKYWDNRLINLRLASRSENNYNAALRLDNKSGVKGVSWSKSMKRWKADITINKVRTIIGYYHDLEEAETAINKARDKAHKQFANTGVTDAQS
jgi:hypothetical protein